MSNEFKVYMDKDIDKSKILDKKIAVIGFGSQGYGQSTNLKDSGCDVVVGLRPNGASAKKAEAMGLKVMSIEDAVEWADVIQILIPDEVQAKVYEEQIKPHLRKGQYLMFAHGFNIHFKKIVPPADVNVLMVAPKGPGHTVRSEYEAGKGVPSLIAVYQDPSGDSKEVALAYASAIGAGRAGIYETNFKEETETDLFGEQCVLCGGLTALLKAGLVDGTSNAVRPLHPTEGANSSSCDRKRSMESDGQFSNAFSSTAVVPAGSVNSCSQRQWANMPRLTMSSAV